MKTRPCFFTTLLSERRASILDVARPLAALILSILLFATPAWADTVVLTLDEHTIPAAIQCGEIWNEAGVDLTIRSHPPACFAVELCDFFLYPDNLALSPAILEVDLAGIPGAVTSAAVVVASPCGDCARQILYNGTSVVDSAAGGGFPPSTVELFASGMPVDRLVVEGCYSTGVHEIQIEYDPISTGVRPTVYAWDAQLRSRPNPFNATTEIFFDLERGGKVQLRVYDVSGRLVRAIVDSELAGGRRTASWDGRDASGRQLPTGVYFIALDVDGRVAASRKIVIAR